VDNECLGILNQGSGTSSAAWGTVKPERMQQPGEMKNIAGHSVIASMFVPRIPRLGFPPWIPPSEAPPRHYGLRPSFH